MLFYQPIRNIDILVIVLGSQYHLRNIVCMYRTVYIKMQYLSDKVQQKAKGMAIFATSHYNTAICLKLNERSFPIHLTLLSLEL
mmetsp:Transcript_39356/g.95193  ORF Transcript_39356/g.95193 Transcript_39356/m.95193 type:complete len:84 (+) Transcript_39356:1480-1731(+)